jgi:small conductance mechanosensitive channel
MNFDSVYQVISSFVAEYGLRIVGAIAILVLGRIGVGIVTGVTGKLMKRAKVEETLRKFFMNVTRIALMVFVVIAALNGLGFQTASIVAVIGAAGLAIGFALQGSLANFASGVMLIIFRPFKKGDYVEAGGASGTIEAIHIFSTVMVTPDNKRVIIPNGSITSNNITNYSSEDKRRIDMVFGIGYGDDIRKAKEILERLMHEDSRILKDPAPVVAVKELGDSSVNFAVRPWVATPDYWGVYFDLTEKVKLTFDKEGISIPFPQRDVHLFQENAA